MKTMFRAKRVVHKRPSQGGSPFPINSSAPCGARTYFPEYQFHHLWAKVTCKRCLGARKRF